MKEDSPLFQQLLKQFPHDQDWDEENQVENAYKAIGLKRYSVQACLGLKKKQRVESKETTFSSATSSVTKGRDGEDPVPVKLEVKEWAVLKADSEVVKAAEKRLAKAIADAKTVKASLMAAASKPESDCLWFLYILFLHQKTCHTSNFDFNFCLFCPSKVLLSWTS